MTDKWERVNVLHRNMRKLDSILERDVVLGNMNAIAVRLMRHTGIRVGGNEAAEGRAIKDATYGATTLRAKHVKTSPSGTLILHFPGKKGVLHRHVIHDRFLIQAFHKLLHSRSGNDPLFDSINNKSTMKYLREVLDVPNLKNHDLRTHIATDIAFAEIKKHPRPKTEKEYRKLRNLVGQVVSEKLGNGRYHALNSYINPVVFNNWRKPGWTP